MKPIKCENPECGKLFYAEKDYQIYCEGCNHAYRMGFEAGTELYMKE